MAYETTPDAQTISRLYNEQCAAEPIHIPGSVQPHGFVVIVDPASALVVQVSTGAARRLKRESPAELIDQPLGNLARASESTLKQLLADLRGGMPQPLALELADPPAGAAFECVGHLAGPWAMLEWFPTVMSPTEGLPGRNNLSLLPQILARIRTAEDDELADIIVGEVRAASGFDRVMLYRFLPDWSGEVIAEACSDDLPESFLGLRFPASDIPPQARRLYATNTLRVLTDVQAEPDALYPQQLPDGAPLDQSHALLRSLSPAHRVYLNNMGVRATMTVSLLRNESLWGMIACHHRVPRTVPTDVRESVRTFSELIASVASVRLTNLEDARRRRDLDSLGKLVDRISEALLQKDELHTLPDFSQGLCEGFEAEAFGVRLGGTHFVFANGAFVDDAEWLLDRVYRQSLGSGPAKEGHALARLREPLHEYGLVGALVLPIGTSGDDFCFLARSDWEREVRWGGKPGDYEVHEEGDRVVLNPRRSFAAWSETVKGECRPWSDPEIHQLHRLCRALRESEDLARLRTFAEEMRRQAETDSLTQVRNRSMLLPGIQHRLGEKGSCLAVILLDLDNFKRINDTLGHNAGDRLLILISEFLRQFASTHGLDIYRMGGDEFVLLCQRQVPCTEKIAHICTALLAQFNRNSFLEVSGIRVGVSLGVACEHLHGGDPETLLRQADMALYEAKRNGRDTFYVFDERIGRQMAEETSLERDLRHDFASGRLQLHYQPRISVVEGRVTGFEALLRWNHETRGWVPPETFVPIAERCGLIGDIGDWVIEEAVSMLYRRERRGSDLVRVAINISALQVFDHGILDRAAALCDARGLDLSFLEFELTETATVADLSITAAFLEQARSRNIRCAIDDFGTGNASIPYLRELAVHYVKIDRSFIVDSDSPEDERILLSGLLSLITGLGFIPVAEGVETPAQLTWLRDHGCLEMQGYLFGRPVEESSISELLRVGHFVS